ncbi:PssD/Cps14F family polysaccharide biosynthesis glycosyltransferase [Weizmannia coagulans]|uniref:PssD/Cps14F family polysaccharide biosynthesis glycosyltransferase n=1 Tax=Heyndrickxia faecalis TaxID=2824910 RepID=A0ABV3NGL6_9BACI|nr:MULTISPECIES: PssD/Cps14F family polysaccharide biosynthesis glycosyltransferase [Heyndrickxia]APB38212.1 polysaccharide biosynthesis protein [Heyndrickxia coagulans]ATW84271.1 polysaccharide biosynthesis protein [Heyndrickxia coagulans]KGB30364.1 polysaccharide biosynthesis protein [Heyndrickxia coagulans]KXT20284.1 polysaccharide biosynthesis protein [Heyndrickxia coagulans]MCR4445363.1 UDP-N-acetylglucosamine transferase subunit ALG14 [Heyndrickxia coagulans]
MRKIALISSTGGHWTQLSILFNELQNTKTELQIVTEKNKSNILNDNLLFLHQQDRKNKYFLAIFILNIIKSLYYVIKFRPNYVISTGAGVVIPYLVFSKIFGAKIIFIESYAKINSPTMTGKIVYKFADEFFVQWPDMLKFYPKAYYKGSLY